MNRVSRLFLVIAALSAATFGVCYQIGTRPAAKVLADSDAEMAWLRAEYHLNNAQFAKISKLHDDYQPQCAERCRKIAAAHAKLRELVASSQTVSPEMEAALKDWTTLENDCRQALLRHVYAVSAEMSPEEGRRYLKMALASLTGASRQQHETMMVHRMD